MKIELLGTGSAEGWPGLFCSCEACRRARQLGGKNLRTRSSALIDDQIKIDLPPDTLHHVLTQGLDMTKIPYLLFTHGHDDHFAVRELQYLSWMFVSEPIRNPLQVFGSPDITTRIQESLDVENLPLEVRCLEAWQTTKIGRWKITPVLAQHDPDQVCFNYLISDGTKTLLYATDTGWYETPTWAYLAKTQIDGVVVECTKGPIEGGYMAHMSIPDVIRMRALLLKEGVLRDGAPVVTTHHSHLGGLLHEELEERLSPHGITVGYDGMTFEI